MLSYFLLWPFIIMTSVDANSGNSQWELCVDTYPENICLGDFGYVMVSLKNQTQNNLIARYFLDSDATNFGVRFSLSHGETSNIPVLFEANDNSIATIYRYPIVVLPNESKVVYYARIQFPPLEDFDLDFWKDLSNSMNEDNTMELYLNCHCNLGSPDSFAESNKITIRKKFLVRKRLKAESNLIEKWHAQSPKEIFPISEVNNNRKIGKADDGYPVVLWDRLITVKNEQYHPFTFVSWTNRTPPQGFCPETWQGWKELEESITPSTLRDEIRLTRILIQYCDTKDEKTLAELKEWFAEMNEIQRTVMKKSIHERSHFAKLSYGNKLSEPYQELCNATSEYDIAARSDSETEFLKQLNLLE